MILRGDYNQILEYVHSRNRSTLGRRSGHIIDIYKSKGQIIARLWPVDVNFEATPAQKAAHDAVRREREIEKRFRLVDIVGLRMRSMRSRYNWWEILGRIHISREYHYPGKTCGIYWTSCDSSGDYWQFSAETDRDAYCEALIVSRHIWPGKGFYWLYETHREAGLENTLRGREAIVPDKILDQHPVYSTSTQHVWRCHKTYMPKGSPIIIRSYSDQGKSDLTGESGIYLLTDDQPNWANAPMDPQGHCARTQPPKL